MSVKNRIWKAKDHEASARTTLLLLQFRIHKNISVCWIINYGRCTRKRQGCAFHLRNHGSCYSIRKRYDHVTNHNTKDLGKRPWKFLARFRHPVALSFQILDDCLWSSTAYAIEIIIKWTLTAFRTSGLSSDLWTPLQGSPGSLISLLIMRLCKYNTFDKNSIWDYLKRVDNVASYGIVMLLAWQRRDQSPPVSCYKANSVACLTRHVTLSRKQNLCTVVGEAMKKNCSLKLSPSSVGMVHCTSCIYKATPGCVCVYRKYSTTYQIPWYLG